MLQVKNFHGSHNSDYILSPIKEMLDQWHIPLTKVHIILRGLMSDHDKGHDWRRSP